MRVIDVGRHEYQSWMPKVGESVVRMYHLDDSGYGWAAGMFVRDTRACRCHGIDSRTLCPEMQKLFYPKWYPDDPNYGRHTAPATIDP